MEIRLVVHSLPQWCGWTPPTKCRFDAHPASIAGGLMGRGGDHRSGAQGCFAGGPLPQAFTCHGGNTFK